jgi:ATP-dependent RNA helicase DeaD
MQNVRVASKPLRMKPRRVAADIDAPKRKRSFGPPRGDKPGGGPRKPGGFKPAWPTLLSDDKRMTHRDWR